MLDILPFIKIFGFFVFFHYGVALNLALASGVTSEESSGEMRLTNKKILDCTQVPPGSVPNPKKLIFFKNLWLVWDPRVPGLAALKGDSLECVNMPLEGGKPFTFVAVNPVTEQLAVGELSGDIVIYSMPKYSYEQGALNLTKEKVIKPLNSIRDYGDAAFDASGTVLVFYSRTGSDIQLLQKVGGPEEHWIPHTLDHSVDFGLDNVSIDKIIADVTPHSFFIAYTQSDSRDSIVTQFDIDPMHPHDSGFQIVDSSFDIASLKGVTDIALTPDGEYLAVAVEYQHSLLFFSKSNKDHEWRLTKHWTNTNSKKADIFSGMQSVASVQSEDGIIFIYAGTHRYIHRFEKDTENWNHVYLDIYEGYNPRLVSLAANSNATDYIVALGSSSRQLYGVTSILLDDPAPTWSGEILKWTIGLGAVVVGAAAIGGTIHFRGSLYQAVIHLFSFGVYRLVSESDTHGDAFQNPKDSAAFMDDY